MVSLRKLASYQKHVFFSALLIMGIILGSFLDGRLTAVKANPESKTFEIKLRQFVKERTNQQVSHISIYFLDLNNNFDAGVNEKFEYDIASLVKLPTMMALFKKAQSDPQFLSKTIIYYRKSSDNLRQNMAPAKELENETVLTVGELIDRMIVFSDNQAYNLLLANIDDDIVRKAFKDLGIDLPDQENAQMYMSAEKYATAFLKVLFNGSYLNKEMSEKALGLLMRTNFKDGLTPGLPTSIKVAHKFGERSWDKISTKQLHDCGIIYYPNHPYLLCVMTRGNSFEAQSQIIKDLSEIVYNLIKT
ncbi:serine hydrolase [Candidatus Microgenomates bacterium]|nr:serine hydrolase [Candidatus Microgenomates bacterium]